MPPERKEAIIRAFAQALRDVRDYIVGPDMGTNERDMARIHDEIGRSVGLPREIGGIPLDEIGATGFGVAIAAEVAQEFCAVKIAGARVAIQGFGAVGKHAARFLAARGAVLVAASDSTATVSDPRGLEVGALIAFKDGGGRLSDYSAGTRMDRDAIVGIECDIWIPAARPDVVTMKNVETLRTKLILQGANIPISSDAENRLHQRGVLVVPDFIANAGGVICAAVEYQRGTQALAMQSIEEKIRENTRAVLLAVRERGITPRQAALELARERVISAMKLRRF
jgi:glutamate dehydrogenase (NAD(P)+)